MTYRDKNDKLNAEALAVDVKAQDPAMTLCLRCGQTFDTRIAGEVSHHDQHTHEPLLPADPKAPQPPRDAAAD